MKKSKTFFGKQFKKIILDKNITQQEIANKLGIARTMISNWINGFRNPSLSSLQKLSEILEVPINYFIESKENKNTSNQQLDEKDIKILQLEKEILELKLLLQNRSDKQNILELMEGCTDICKEEKNLSDLAKKKLKIYIEKFKKSKRDNKLKDKRLIDFLGTEHPKYKNVEAISKLLEFGNGYIPEAFERDYFGKIMLMWGQENMGGLAHIIKRRKDRNMSDEELEKFLINIPDIIRTGKISFNEENQRYEFTKNKKILIIDVLMADKGIKFLLSGFKEDNWEIKK